MNKDIGFIREGQAVRVKLEAFNFTDYGIVPGMVESISRDAIDMSQPGQQAQRDGAGPCAPQRPCLCGAYPAEQALHPCARGAIRSSAPALPCRPKSKPANGGSLTFCYPHRADDG